MASSSLPNGNLQFVDCVRVVLRGWTALQLAIQHGFGGIHSEEKGMWLGEAVAEFFSKNRDLKYYEVNDVTLTSIVTPLAYYKRTPVVSI